MPLKKLLQNGWAKESFCRLLGTFYPSPSTYSRQITNFEDFKCHLGLDAKEKDGKFVDLMTNPEETIGDGIRLPSVSEICSFFKKIAMWSESHGATLLGKVWHKDFFFDENIQRAASLGQKSFKEGKEGSRNSHSNHWLETSILKLRNSKRKKWYRENSQYGTRRTPTGRDQIRIKKELYQ